MQLTDKFIIPPISILDVKQGYWKQRRKQWLELGIQSEIGRGENLLSLSSLMKTKHNGTSIFDPVLCEIMYKWFSKEDDIVMDRFCGGSVRGIVAEKLNRRYIGIDIREEQLEVNREAVKAFGSNSEYYNTQNIPNTKYDLFFTCPPYFNLERYSDREDDLSNMDEDKWWIEYKNILSESITNLKEDRFGVIVIGDVRREDGSYMKLPQRTIEIMEGCGLKYYNELILLQEPATAAMRANKFMDSSRKIAKCHQNVLVFVKGDEIKATQRLGEVVGIKERVNDFFE
jgi:DNA modification methylase